MNRFLAVLAVFATGTFVASAVHLASVVTL